MYRYVDEKDTVSFTDSRDNIPERFRDRAEDVSDSNLTGNVMSIAEDAKEGAKDIKAEKKKWLEDFADTLKNAIEGQGMWISIALLIILVIALGLGRKIKKRLVVYLISLLAMFLVPLVMLFIFKPKEMNKAVNMLIKYKEVKIPEKLK
jgi:hypothetical protein